MPPSPAVDRLRRRRAELGLPAGDGDALLVDPVTGAAVPVDALPLHLRRARTTRTSLEANTGICRGMLRVRYDSTGAVRIHGYHQQPVVDEVPEPVVNMAAARRRLAS